MPIYAYKCGACGKSHDALQKMSDAPLTDCPHCGAAPLTKQVTAAGFQLKGSGWYVTDFRNNGQSTGKPAPDKVAADSAAQSDATSTAASTATPTSSSPSDGGGKGAAAPAPAASAAAAPAPASPSTGSGSSQG